MLLSLAEFKVDQAFMFQDKELIELFLNKTPLIDVRAPVEFKEGIIPFSVNLPLMTDQERHQVGLCYKENGQHAAIELGHQLVSGATKTARIQAWLDFLKLNPEAQVFCFRGGLRSQISCQWISEHGMARSPIKGGYKRLRQFFLSWLEVAPLPKLVRIAGPTGSGKSHFLIQFPKRIDLEGLAHHRGSAFGQLGPQPSQITFENNLALHLINQDFFYIEDESSHLGDIRLPNRFYQHLRQSPMVVLRVPLEERIKNIFQDYVSGRDKNFFLQATQKIARKLGGERTDRLMKLIEQGFLYETLESHSPWITLLLTEYYDPMYEKDLARQKLLVLKEGSASELQSFLGER
jgi:tRNA 2-selenouridine synthase